MIIRTEQDSLNDALARKVTRFLVVFQVFALLSGIVFILIRLSPIALWIAFISLVMLLGALIWFFIRYRSLHNTNIRRKIFADRNELQAQILANDENIKLAQQNRVKIEQAEQSERSEALREFQDEYIEKGMVSTLIADADIPGIGPRVKRQLAGHGFTTAKNTTWNVFYVNEIAIPKKQAILSWRNNVFINLIETKPKDLPAAQLEAIKKKYETQHELNDAEQRKLEETNADLQQQLAPPTFGAFLRKSMAFRGIAAAVIGFGLIISLLLLGSSATYATVLLSIPTATMTSTVTPVPTATATMTMTASPTPTYTPTFTITPTVTNTPRPNFTPGHTYTPTPNPTTMPSSSPTLAPP